MTFTSVSPHHQGNTDQLPLQVQRQTEGEREIRRYGKGRGVREREGER